ncbi:hypothetical protein RKF84_27255 [Klebsiella pneumoniae]|nr:hypothetical protein [Klebsiella pneumoniae]
MLIINAGGQTGLLQVLILKRWRVSGAAAGAHPQRWRVNGAADGGYPQRWRGKWAAAGAHPQRWRVKRGRCRCSSSTLAGKTDPLPVLILNAGG